MLRFRELLVLLLLLYGGMFPTAEANRYALESQLKDQLFRSYDRDIVPTQEGRVNVTLGLMLITFDLVDKENDVASIYIKLSKSWTDHRLKWDPAAHNVTRINVQRHHVWIPDVELWDSADTTESFPADILLYSDGTVVFVPQLKIQFTCRMDLTYFPYDEQSCWLRFGSWAHGIDVIDLNHGASYGQILGYHHTGRDFDVKDLTWKKHLLSFPDWPDTFTYMDFTVHLSRKSGPYGIELVLPAVLTGFLILATFLLPPASYEKITLCGLLFLGILIQLSLLHDVVPAVGSTLLGEYLVFVLFVDFLAVAAAVVSYRLYHHRSASKLEQRYAFDAVELKGEDVKKTRGAETKENNKSTDISAYFDVATFALFLVVFIIGTAVILSGRE